jgi:hypothetical protein
LRGRSACAFIVGMNLTAKNGVPIFGCRGFKHDIKETWSDEKNFE